MAMVQVVVTLSETDYKTICRFGWVPDSWSKDIGNAIKEGVVLPKGHGKLLDADGLESEFDMLEKVTNEGSLAERTEHKKLLECISIVKTAPTIIEADKDEAPATDEQELKEAAGEEVQEHTESDTRSKRTKFILNGCDISFIAEAPEDMTVKQLIEQADRIEPHWCACGVCKDTGYENTPAEIIFDYNSVRKASDDVCCEIRQV